MRIAVVGAGGVGGGFGAALAKAGADVSFIARGAHLADRSDQGGRRDGQRRCLAPLHGEYQAHLHDRAGCAPLRAPDDFVLRGA